MVIAGFREDDIMNMHPAKSRLQESVHYKLATLFDKNKRAKLKINV